MKKLIAIKIDREDRQGDAPSSIYKLQHPPLPLRRRYGTVLHIMPSLKRNLDLMPDIEHIEKVYLILCKDLFSHLHRILQWIGFRCLQW